MITENTDKSHKCFGKKWKHLEIIEWRTKDKGAEKCFHPFILRLWREIEDIERKTGMEGVAAHAQFCDKHPEQSQKDFLK